MPGIWGRPHGPLLPVQMGDLYGFITRAGEVAIPPRFSDARDFVEGLASVSPDGQRWGAIDLTGEMVVPPVFDFVWPFSEGIAVVRQQGQHGYVDRRGDLLVPADYTFAFGFRDGLGQVCRATTKCSSDAEFIQLTLQDRVEQWFVNRRFQRCIPGTFHTTLGFSEGYAFVRKLGQNRLWSCIAMDGTEVLPPSVSDCSPFSEGLAGLALDGRYWYVDRAWRKQFDTESWISPGRVFRSGLLPAADLGEEGPEADILWGYLGTDGRFAIAPRFRVAESFSEGLAVVRDKSGRWGAITMDGRWAIDPVFEELFDFEGGVASCRQNGRDGYVDPGGRVLLPP